MNILDQFRYSRDDPSQLNIKLKQDPYEKVGTSKNQNINNLLSTSPNTESTVAAHFSENLIQDNCLFASSSFSYRDLYGIFNGNLKGFFSYPFSVL